MINGQKRGDKASQLQRLQEPLREDLKVKLDQKWLLLEFWTRLLLGHLLI